MYAVFSRYFGSQPEWWVISKSKSYLFNLGFSKFSSSVLFALVATAFIFPVSYVI